MPARTSWSSTIFRPGSAGRCRPRRNLVEGDVGDQDLVRQLLLRKQCRRHHPFRRLDRGAGIGRRSARLLSQQHRKSRARCIAVAVEARIPHFIFSSTAAVYGIAEVSPVAEDVELKPISPYGTLEADDRDHAARRGGGASDLRYVALRYFNVAGADPKGRAASRRRTRPISSRSPRRPRSASGPISKCSAPTTRRRTAPACATISMSAIWSRPSRALSYLRAGRQERGVQLRLRRRLLGA